MFRMFARKHKKEKAQGMVEFALILPLLLLVILGIVEFGRLLFFYSSVTSASREAARYGSAVGDVGGVDRFEDCAGILAAAQRAGTFANIEAADITIQYDDGTALLDANCPPTADIGLADRVVVTVQKSFSPLVPLVNLPALPVTSTTARTIIMQVGVEGTPAPTSTLPPTDTPEGADTATPTDTPSNTPTETATATATATETATATPTATATGTLLPSNTPAPTATFTDTPTFTPEPVCAVTVLLYSASDYKVTWEIENTGNRDLRMYQLSVEFPDASNEYGALEAIAFEDPIWTGSLNSIADIFEDDWNQGVATDRDLIIGHANRKLLALTFDKKGTGLEPYQLDIYLRSTDGVSCTVYETWISGE